MGLNKEDKTEKVFIVKRNSHFLFGVACFFIFGLVFNTAFAQTCNLDDKGNIIKYSKGCAPRDPEWEIIYIGLDLPAKVVVDWGDGIIDKRDATSTTFQEVFSHTYPKDEGVCTYNVIAYVESNGVRCQETEQEQKITVWDTDNPADGKLSIDPFVFRVCYGNAANINFVDNSSWNCFNPSETSTPNEAPRWIQWEYGTGNPLNRIPGVQINGSSPSFPYKINPPIYPVYSPGLVSDNIFVPATTTAADVGKEFEVTLRNWNQCNPYDVNLGDGAFNPVNGDLENGDSAYVLTTAKIVIVAPPDPAFTPRKGSYGGAESYQFCPGETIFFNNTTSGSFYSYTWNFTDPSGNPLPKKYSKNVTNSFSTAGTYKVLLEVTDNNVSGACVAKKLIEIEIIDSPVPDFEISANGSVAATTDFCEIVAGDYDFSLANKTTVPSGASPVYVWRLSRVSDGVSLQTETTNDINELFEFSLSQPGAYELSLNAKDAVTACSNTYKDTINLYNAPEASFEIASNQELCVGRLTEFTDLSDFVTPKGFADDAIVSWKWWFDYNGDPLSAYQSDDQNPSHIFSIVKSYNVRLEVATKYGCVDDTIINLVVNPVAQAEITVDDPDGCAPHEPTFTNVHANSQPASVTVEKYRWYGYYNGTPVFDVEQLPDGGGVFVDTFAYSFPYTRLDNQNQMYKVVMEAYATGGCKTTSDTIEITVFPSAVAKFISDYNPLGSNCTPDSVNFEVDAATKALPFTKDYRWTVSDENGIVFQSPTSAIDTFYYNFTSQDSIAIKTYEVTLEVIASGGSCMQPYTQQIKINPTPSSKFTSTVSRECEYVVLNLDANQKGLSPSNYYWTFIEQSTGAVKKYENNPALDDSFGLQFLRGDADSTVEVTLRTRNFAGCESTGPTQQFLIPKKDAFAILLDTMAAMPKCAPMEITFYNNSNVPAGTNFELKVRKGSNPTVTVPDSLITGDLTDPQFTYTFPEAGEYIVSLVGEYSDGCKGQSDINITINPEVKAVFNPGSTTVCPGEQVLLNEASQPATGIAYKTWTITNLDNSTDSTVFGSMSQYIFDAPGNYEIKLVVESAQGCTDEEVKAFTVLPRPEFTVNYNASSCDQTFTFSITATDPTIAVSSYEWNWGDGKIETTTADSAFHIYLNRNGYSGQDVYNGSVKATSGNGCTYTAPFTVKLLQDVSANFLMDKNKGCAPLSVVFDDVSIGAVSQDWTYREILPSIGGWKSFDGMSTVFQNSSDTAKVFEVRLVSYSPDGCEDSAIKKVTVYPQVTADFSFVPGDHCSPYGITFVNNSNGLSNSNIYYTWNWGDGTKEEVTSEASIDHVFQNSSFSINKNFKVRLTAIDSTSGCTSFLEKTVLVYPSLRAEIEPMDTLGCSPLKVEFSNDFNGVAVHEWYAINTSTGDVVSGSESANPAYAFEFTNNSFDTVRYLVVYKGTSSQGCITSDSAAILVYPDIVPSFSATPQVQNLPNSTVTITNTTHNNPDYVYEWNFGNGVFSSERNPGPVKYDTYGLFTITLKVTDKFVKCGKEVSQTIEIKPTIPEIDFEYNPAEGCGPLTVQFTSKSKFVDPGTLLWDFGDNSTSFSSEPNPVYTYYEPGEYTVTLQGTNAIGVTVTESKKYIIKVYENPRANFRVRQRMPVYMPDSVIFLNESRGAVSYLWDFGDGNTSTEFEPKHAYAKPGNYTIKLIAISELGCADTLIRAGEIEIAGQFEVKIPNVFTPNGDQDNEIFLPLMQGVVEYHLLVFNRWGELLFESKNAEVGWDGYYKGVLSPPDVYVYKLDLKFTNGERTTKYGDITLLR